MKKSLFTIFILVIAVATFGTISVGINYDISGIYLPSGSGIDVSVSVNKGTGATYHSGEELGITFKTDRSAYVTILNIQPDGRIKVLFPNKYDTDNFVTGGTTYSLPTKKASLDYGLTVDRSRGKEIIYAIASASPLGFINSLYFSDVFPFPYLSINIGNLETSLSFGFSSNWGTASTYFYSNYSPILADTKIDCDRSRASVYIDGLFMGTTPLYTQLEMGSHAIYIRGDRGLEYGPEIINIKDFNPKFFFNLIPSYPYGYLEVNSIPDNVSVYVDGEYAGTTPYRDYEKIGNRKVSVSKWAYHEDSANVYINQNETSGYTFELLPKTEAEVKKDRNMLIIGGLAIVAIVAVLIFAF